MTEEGLVMAVCARLRILEPTEFWQLSEGAQTAWLQYEADLFTGAFTSQTRGEAGPASAAADAEWRRLHGGEP